MFFLIFLCTTSHLWILYTGCELSDCTRCEHSPCLWRILWFLFEELFCGRTSFAAGTRKVPDLIFSAMLFTIVYVLYLLSTSLYRYLKSKFGASNFSRFHRLDSKYSESGFCGHRYGLAGCRDVGLEEIF